MTELPPASRPQTVTAAFWCWIVGALLLVAGGVLTAFVPLPTLFRGLGAVTAVAGAGMAFLAGRTRDGDAKFQRAATALSLALVIVVAASAALGVVNVLTLVAVLPLIAGTVAIRSASARAWFERQAPS